MVNNICDIPTSQLPKPLIKGDIDLQLLSPKMNIWLHWKPLNLHGRIIYPKGDTPLKVDDLCLKLSNSWKSLGKWGLISLGKGYFKFTFFTIEDLKTVWIRISGLTQEYWRPRILFAIASSIGTLFCMDEATNKYMFERSYGHFARILVDLDLTGKIRENILVERTNFAFFVNVVYENLLDCCDHYKIIGHNVGNCRRINGKPRQSDSDSSESDFVDASQQHNLEDELLGDQDPSLNKALVRIDSPTHGIPSNPKVNDVEFLKQSWANMAEMEQDRDNEVHIEDDIEEFDAPFQQVVPKHKKKKIKKLAKPSGNHKTRAKVESTSTTP
ncbi:uncharacterized protein LOC131623083 [Vicia villosa]|uniref:uncharacterized protein LOC131623083 n=1 Tax=Vicia villosa TaxID=3911 RepID=UPI00273BFBF9|nr:uncharacterized protein LOC131623083 [Vicia villosa]